MGFIEREYEVDVPKGSGRAGFIKALDAILRMPRVQTVHIDARGRVTCSRMVEENEEVLPLSINLETLSPYAIIRNKELVELHVLGADSTHEALRMTMDRPAIEQLWPIAIVVGAQTTVFTWLGAEEDTRFGASPSTTLYGQPLLRDRAVEDNVLFLCAGYTRGAELPDMVKAFKITMLENIS